MTAHPRDGVCSQLAPGVTKVVRDYFGLAADLPEPSVRFHGTQKHNRRGIQKLVEACVVEKLERCTGDHPDCPHDRASQCYGCIYQTTRAGWEVIQTVIDNQTLLPCGHPAFRNPRDIDGFACTVEWCDAIHSRDTVEEVIGR